MTVNIQIRDLPEDRLYSAIQNIEHFAMQYPNRVGVRDCCIYTDHKGSAMAVYRTKGGMIVARGERQ